MDNTIVSTGKRIGELLINELKYELGIRGLSKTGNKKILKERLYNDIIEDAVGIDMPDVALDEAPSNRSGPSHTHDTPRTLRRKRTTVNESPEADPSLASTSRVNAFRSNRSPGTVSAD